MMVRFEHMVVLAAFLAVGFGAPAAFAGDPAPTGQKERMNVNGGKADDTKKDEKKGKKGMGGK